MKKFFSSARSIPPSEPIGDPNERTLVIIKGDAIARKLTGKIISRIEELDLDIIAIKKIKFDKESVGKMYSDHHDADFYNKMENYLCNGFHIAMVIQGRDAIIKISELKGTRESQARSKSIRKLFAIDSTISSMHSSDGPASAKKEIEMWFDASELADLPLAATFYTELASDPQIKH